MNNQGLAPVVQKLVNAIQWINIYPVDSAIGFPNTFRWIVIYPMDSAIQRLNNRGQVYNPGMDKHPIQWGIVILLAMLHAKET